ncbi:MAG: DUF3298 domain-containing protein, partial [Thermomonas sp.]
MRLLCPPLARTVLAASLALVGVAGCQRGPEAGAAAEAPAAAPAGPAAEAGPPALEDVTETTPAYIIGISYPQAAVRYPPLARALQDYAAAVQDQLMQAVGELKGRKPAVPYDLSLNFSMVAETPRVVAVAATGSSYLGGAHGAPLEQRFVWLPQRQQMLAAEQLIPEPTDWGPVSDYVRARLKAQVQRDLDDDHLDDDVRAEQMQMRGGMIDEGTAPKPAHFARFEPVMNADGSIRALRFVFPPYQVAPYVEGTQTVEVPAKVLLPLVAPAYRPLFRAG